MSSTKALSNEHQAVEVDALCTLLRTELSACEAYRTAIHAVERGEGAPALSLRCLYRSHRRFTDGLRGLVREMGGLPSDSVGARGVWAGVHERVATMAGRGDGPATLRVLRHGERYSLDVARDALDELEGPTARWVEEKLVKGIEANLGLLDALESSVDDRRGGPASA